MIISPLDVAFTMEPFFEQIFMPLIHVGGTGGGSATSLD